jgi:hypothetical protein
MAQKRMFDLSIVDQDKFIDMPISSRLLYYELGMRADDEGFISPQRVIRMMGLSIDDLKVLISKSFVISFESGVVVITDFKNNNWLDSRRIKKTIYQQELGLLTIKDNKYMLSNGLALAKQMLRENRIEEKRIEEYIPEKKEKNIFTKKYINENKNEILREAQEKYPDKDCAKVLEEFLTGIEIKDYKYKNYKLAFYKWIQNSKHTTSNTFYNNFK